MGKALWDKKLLFVFGRKDNALPFSISLASRAQIDSDVKHFAGNHTDQLCLGMGLLEMKAANTFGSTIRIPSMAVLVNEKFPMVIPPVVIWDYLFFTAAKSPRRCRK